MGMVFTGVNAKTAENLTAGAGLLVIDLDMETFNGDVKSIPEEKKLGATEGGVSVECTPEFVDYLDGVDDVVGVYKETLDTTTWTVKMSGTLIEFSKKNIELLLANYKNIAKTNFDGIQPVAGLDTTKFLDRLSLLTTIRGETKPAVIEMRNVLNKNGWNFTTEGNNRGKMEFEFEAHPSISAPDEIPLTIYRPKA